MQAVQVENLEIFKNFNLRTSKKYDQSANGQQKSAVSPALKLNW